MNERPSVFRILTACLVVTVGVALASIGPARNRRNPGADPARFTVERKTPAAVARHIKRFEALPGLEGMGPEGPGSADAERFFARAFPDTDIPLARIEAARSAAARLKGKPFPQGKGRPGTWVTIGPSNALYPFTQFRSSSGYVPNAYVAGGRATAIAIDPTCAPGHCRLWVFAAGGGVWRTKNALSGEPHWEFLSPGFGIQSGSAITLDPNDPSGDTLYVGTGEANASGDSAAGTGMYKSADGGDTLDRSAWSLGLQRPGDRQHRRQAGRPEHDLCGDDARRPRRVVGDGRHGVAHPRCRGVGTVQVDRWR